MQWRKSKPIGFVIAEVVGLHVEQCKSASWHRLLNASQGLPRAAAEQQGCSCTALWGNISMCADKLGPVARGLVVDWVYSRVLIGGSCHLHHQHIGLYSLWRTQLLLSNFCVYSNVLRYKPSSHKGTGARRPTCRFLEPHFLSFIKI